MPARPTPKPTESSTEEKIKHAARSVFLSKGFAATRTRDIAEEAGINLALLNYYYRSKEKLFDLIMVETMRSFFQTIYEVFNRKETTLNKKIEILADKYIDLLIANPDIPTFLMSEMRRNPAELMSKMGMGPVIMKSFFIEQFRQGVNEGKITDMHPLHFIMNLMGMIVFPFISNPMLKALGGISQKQFDAMMLERKKCIPKWIKTTLNTKL